MSQLNVDVVRSVYDAYDSGDLDQIYDSFDESAEVIQSDGLPWGGVYKGPNGVQAYLDNLSEHIHCNIESDGFLDAGDEVVQFGRTVGEVAATGVRFSIPEVHLWRLRDGKIVSFHPYVDHVAQLDALGATSN